MGIELDARARVELVTGKLAYEQRPWRYTTEERWAEWLVIREVYRAVGEDVAQVMGITDKEVDEALQGLQATKSKLLNNWKEQLREREEKYE